MLTSDIVVSSEIDAVGKNKIYIENGKLSSGRTTLNALNSWAEKSQAGRASANDNSVNFFFS